MVNNFLESFIRSATDVYVYNPVNTLLFALIFAGGVYLIYEQLIKRFKLKMNRNFLFAASMWAFFAMSIRLLYDTGYTKSVLFITPYVTVIDFALAVGFLIVALYIEKKKKIDYWKTWGMSGALLGLVLLSLSPLNNWSGFVKVVALWAVSFIILIWAKKIFPKFFTWWNIGVLQTHMMDAAGSFIGITFFAFSEEHVVGRTLMAFAESAGMTVYGSGSWIMYPLKLIVLIPILYYLDRYSENMQETKYIKTILFVLGFAIGLRNAFNILILGG